MKITNKFYLMKTAKIRLNDIRFIHRPNAFVIFLILRVFCIITFCQEPCKDSLYNYLKSVELDSMSQRQYEYFMLKEKYCLEHTSSNQVNKQQNQTDDLQIIKRPVGTASKKNIVQTNTERVKSPIPQKKQHHVLLFTIQ